MMDDPDFPPPAPLVDGPPSGATSGDKLPSDDAPVDVPDVAAVSPGTVAPPTGSPPPSARSSSLSSLSGDSGGEGPAPAAGGQSQVRWAETDGPGGPSADLSELADPLVYDATRATVGAVLGRAADLLKTNALPQLEADLDTRSAATEVIQRVLTAVRRSMGTASASVHRIVPLGLRLAEHVMTVSQWRAVQARSRSCARQAIYQALLELQLSEDRQQARRLLRALRRRPARLWADLSLEEAAAELASRRPPERYPGGDPARDAGRETETALLTAYRAAARDLLLETVPPAPLPPAAGLDEAARVAAVHEVIRSWRYSIRWRYCVDFLRTEEEPLLSRHIYQVRRRREG